MIPKTEEVYRSGRGGCMYLVLLLDGCLHLDVGCYTLAARGREVEELMTP